MKIHIPPFDKACVLVVGDVMLDRYWHGGTSRISPEAPVPVVHVGQSEERAGGAANVALNILTNYFNHVAETEIDFPAAPELAAA